MADLDGDGCQDLAVSRSTGDSVTIMTNDGDGRFQHRQTFPAGAKPMGLCALDADDDGALDVAVVCYDDDLLVLRYNTATIWPPAPVTDLTAALAGSIIRLNWSPVTVDQIGQPMVVDHYTVYRQTDPYSVPATEDSLGGTAECFFEDAGAALKDPGTNHYYAVRAVSSGGEKSEASAAVGEFDTMLQEAAGTEGRERAGR